MEDLQPSKLDVA